MWAKMPNHDWICLLQSFRLYLKLITCLCAEKGAGGVIYMEMYKVWIGFFTLVRLHPDRTYPGMHPQYLLQLVQELLVARILTAAGLDQAVAQVISDHLGGVQVSEDSGKQV